MAPKICCDTSVMPEAPGRPPVWTIVVLAKRLALSQSEPDNDAVMALLFAADRTDHLATDITPKLDAGVHVICDRYYLSTFAYQSRSVDLAWLRTLHARCARPDLTILLDVSPKVCCQRIAEHRWQVELYEQEAILEGVRRRYHDIAAQLRSEGQDIRIVAGDGGRSIAEVHTSIVEQVKTLL